MRSIISTEAEATEDRGEVTRNKSFHCSEEEAEKFIIIGFYGDMLKQMRILAVHYYTYQFSMVRS